MDNEELPDISRIIIRYLNGNATEDEILRLQDWLAASPEHFALFRQYENDWLKTGASCRYDVEKAWEKVGPRLLQKKIRLKWIRYAAAVVGLFLGGYTALTLIPHRHENVFPGENIEPGANRAVLVLGSNEKVLLDDRTNDSLWMKHVDARKEGNTLVYARNNPVTGLHTYNRLITPRGGEYSVILSDGTKVWLNAESELKYPVHFDGKERKVFLKGEAYFAVSKQEGGTFVVCVDDAQITVLGTEFNVRRYQEEKLAATLVRGSVAVTCGEGKACRLKPGQQAVVDGNDIRVNEVETILYTAWKDGYFIYRDKTLDEILKELSRWYDFSYFYQNSEIGEELLTAKLRKFDRVEEVFEVLSGTGHFDFRTKGKTVTVIAK